MFREMRRFKQALTQDEIEEVLRSERRAVLSLIGDDGYPYGVPLNFWYDEENQRICFHGAAQGHKIDAAKANFKASCCVIEPGVKEEKSWALLTRSVIAFGVVSMVKDTKRAEEICRRIAARFTDDEDYIDADVLKNLKGERPRVCCFELWIEHMTGKHIREA